MTDSDDTCPICGSKDDENLNFTLGSCRVCWKLRRDISENVDAKSVIALARRMGSITDGDYAEKLMRALCLGLKDRLELVDGRIDDRAFYDHEH